MKVILQRVNSASVSVDGEVVSEIGKGLVCFCGIRRDDVQEDWEFCMRKIVGLKVFPNEKGQMWRHNVKNVNGEILLVSQFTLFGIFNGNKIDYHLAMNATESKEYYDRFVAEVRKSYMEERVKDGVFGAYMDVKLENDGPVTLVIDSRDRNKKTSKEGKEEIQLDDS